MPIFGKNKETEEVEEIVTNDGAEGIALENVQAEGLEKEVQVNDSEEPEKEVDDSVPFEEEDVMELSQQESFIQDVKAMRTVIDSLITKSASHLGHLHPCTKSFFKAKSWLGNVLFISQLGDSNPYPEANNVKTIPPTKDVADVNMYAWNLLGELEKVNALRADCRLSIDEVESLSFEGLEIEDGRLLAIGKTNAYTNLCEARFELGNELAIMRNR
jgi:hypothetical protein